MTFGTLDTFLTENNNLNIHKDTSENQEPAFTIIAIFFIDILLMNPHFLNLPTQGHGGDLPDNSRHCFRSPASSCQGVFFLLEFDQSFDSEYWSVIFRFWRRQRFLEELSGKAEKTKRRGRWCWRGRRREGRRRRRNCYSSTSPKGNWDWCEQQFKKLVKYT